MPSQSRCHWVNLDKPDYIAYHDNEWGVPVFDDDKMFEFLILESAQAGLSWYTILKKRENYRKAFANFDVHKVAKFDDEKIEALMQDAGIVRNRLKINAAINNAKLFIDIQQEFGSFCKYIWAFVGNQVIVNHIDENNYPVTSPESDAISKDMKKRGFKFFGSTICYAHMQATGLVNDHSDDCFRKQEIIDNYPQVFTQT